MAFQESLVSFPKSSTVYQQKVVKWGASLVLCSTGHQQEIQGLLNNMSVVVELLTVLTEVQQSLGQSGFSVLFDHDKLSLVSMLIIRG